MTYTHAALCKKMTVDIVSTTHDWKIDKACNILNDNHVKINMFPSHVVIIEHGILTKL